MTGVEVILFKTRQCVFPFLSLWLFRLAVGETFHGFSNVGWFVLLVQGIVCQLLAWLLISYATKHMRATRVSVSLLGQAVFASLLAWAFLDEAISLQMIIGGFILLFGIRITFYQKRLLTRKRESLITE